MMGAIAKWQRELLREALEDYNQRLRHDSYTEWPLDRLVERFQEILKEEGDENT